MEGPGGGSSTAALPPGGSGSGNNNGGNHPHHQQQWGTSHFYAGEVPQSQQNQQQQNQHLHLLQQQQLMQLAQLASGQGHHGQQISMSSMIPASQVCFLVFEKVQKDANRNVAVDTTGTVNLRSGQHFDSDLIDAVVDAVMCTLLTHTRYLARSALITKIAVSVL